MATTSPQDGGSSRSIFGLAPFWANRNQSTVNHGLNGGRDGLATEVQEANEGQSTERRLEEGTALERTRETDRHRRLRQWLRPTPPHRRRDESPANTENTNDNNAVPVDDDEALRGIPLATLPIHFTSPAFNFQGAHAGGLATGNKAKERERESRKELKTFWGPRVVLDPTDPSDGAPVVEEDPTIAVRSRAQAMVEAHLNGTRSEETVESADDKQSMQEVKLGQAELETLMSPEWTKSTISTRQVSEWTRRANAQNDSSQQDPVPNAILSLESNVHRSSVEVRTKTLESRTRSNLLFTLDCEKECQVQVIFFAKELAQAVDHEPGHPMESDRFVSCWPNSSKEMRWTTNLHAGYRQNTIVPIPEAITWSQCQTILPGSHLDPTRNESDRLVAERKKLKNRTGKSGPPSPEVDTHHSSDPSSRSSAQHATILERIKGKKVRSPVLSASDATSIELDDTHRLGSDDNDGSTLDGLEEKYGDETKTPGSSSDSPVIWPIVIVVQSLEGDFSHSDDRTLGQASSSRSPGNYSSSHQTNAQMTFLKLMQSASGSITARVARQSAKIGEMTLTLHEIYGVGESDAVPFQEETEGDRAVAGATPEVDALNLGTSSDSKELPPTLHLCVICLSEARTSLMLPCRHLALCADCANQVMESGSRYGGSGARGWNCVICRRPFHSIVDIRREKRVADQSGRMDESGKDREVGTSTYDDTHDEIEEDALRLRGGATNLESSISSPHSSTIVSAPGKVLMAGGYLVLDPEYRGHVLSTSARFYSAVQATDDDLITIRSPQFTDGLWLLTMKDRNECKELVPDRRSGQNHYVQTTIEIVSNIAAHLGKGLGGSGLDVTLLADNDFYSQRVSLVEHELPSTLPGLRFLPRFNSTHGSMKNVHKTGLGSSAALITSLTCALMIHYKVIERDSIESRREDALTFVHNVAQYAHCVVQGKIGSGFDISAAIYGSQSYRRFRPSVFAPYLDWKKDFIQAASQAMMTSLVSTLRAPLGNESKDHFSLPPGIRLLLGDVDAGSHTPSMVSKVMAWKSTHPEEGNALFRRLNRANEEMATHLSNLCRRAAEDPEAWSGMLSRALQAVEGSALDDLKKLMKQIRGHLKDLGNAAQVPIEPNEQSRLLDALELLPGVVGGCVPGGEYYLRVLAQPPY